MKVGFSILSHKKADAIYVELIQQLLRYPNHQIAIHHDFSKSDLGENIYQYPTVQLVDDFVTTNWSHVNNIEALMKTFTILYEQNCDWYVTLSANCFPIKTPQQLVDFLSNSNYDGYIEHHNVLTNHYDFYTYFRKAINTKYLFKIPFIRKNGEFYWRAIRTARRTSNNIFSSELIPYHGSDWFMINKKTMAYILSNRDKVSRITSLLREINKGPDLNICPSEMVFQTILANKTDFKLCQNNLRYIDWENSQDWHPNLLNEMHWSTLLNSDSFFARKLDETSSLSLMNQICNLVLK